MTEITREAAAEAATLAAGFAAQVDGARGSEAALQKLQADVVHEIYGLLDFGRQVTAPLNAVYGDTVKALEELLGTEVHVGRVDCDMYEMLHNVFKGENGFRPGFHTRAAAEAYLAPFRRPPNGGDDAPEALAAA